MEGPWYLNFDTGASNYYRSEPQTASTVSTGFLKRSPEQSVARSGRRPGQGDSGLVGVEKKNDGQIQHLSVPTVTVGVVFWSQVRGCDDGAPRLPP